MKRKTLALSFLMALAFACSLWILPVQTVESQSFETIYIRVDGSFEGTDLIVRHDNTYTFLNDIFGNIVISKDNITIDGSGYALKGTGISSQTGISLSNRKNVTVTNIVIMNYSIGISCKGTTSNITILNNYISGCGIGVEFLGSSNNLIKYVAFKNNDIDIAVDYVSGNNLITLNNLNSYVQMWLSDQPTMDKNFWADYNGTDSDGDGIGDSPYFYHGILQDNHPLMKPIVIPGFPEPTSSPEPTPTPYEEPKSTEQVIILGVAITIIVIVAGLGLLYLFRRKQSNKLTSI